MPRISLDSKIPDAEDVKVFTEDYRNYVLTNRDNEVDVPKLEPCGLVSGFGESYTTDSLAFDDSSLELKRAAAKLGATHVFGLRFSSRSFGSSNYTVRYTLCGDAYRPVLNQDKSEVKS